MTISYFKTLTWSQITREERAFCAELFFQVRQDPERFVRLLQKEAGVPNGLSGPWDVAYEACFYRDYLHAFEPRRKPEFSGKRTFDLALFSDQAIIIIEAKAAEAFTAKQSKDFARDVQDLPKVIKCSPVPTVYLVALGTKTYFDNYTKFGRGSALRPFAKRHLTWEAIAQEYPSAPLLQRACTVYERTAITIVEADTDPVAHLMASREEQIALLKAEIEQRERALRVLESEADA